MQNKWYSLQLRLFKYLFEKERKKSVRMSRYIVLLLCISMATTQRNGNMVKSGEWDNNSIVFNLFLS